MVKHSCITKLQSCPEVWTAALGQGGKSSEFSRYLLNNKFYFVVFDDGFNHIPLHWFAVLEETRLCRETHYAHVTVLFSVPSGYLGDGS